MQKRSAQNRRMYFIDPIALHSNHPRKNRRDHIRKERRKGVEKQLKIISTSYYYLYETIPHCDLFPPDSNAPKRVDRRNPWANGRRKNPIDTISAQRRREGIINRRKE